MTFSLKLVVEWRRESPFPAKMTLVHARAILSTEKISSLSLNLKVSAKTRVNLQLHATQTLLDLSSLVRRTIWFNLDRTRQFLYIYFVKTGWPELNSPPPNSSQSTGQASPEIEEIK